LQQIKIYIGGFVAYKRPKNPPPCPVKKSDSAIHSLTFSGVVITT